VSETEAMSVEPIAIVGMACRVPGAGNVTQFWENLVEGVESIRIGTLEEQANAGVSRRDLDDPDFVPASAVLAEPERFDAGMFGMSASEADLRDPQQLLFLELAYTALENGGYDPRRYNGDIAVYAGCGEDAYQWRNVRRNRAALARSGMVSLAVYSHPDYVGTLTSFKLGLRGPSLTVHTACSTSLVAVHLASEALRSGECDMALAGGANLILPLGHGYVYSEGGIYSRDGHCRAFDAGATGTVGGSGGGVVLLKRLEDAVRDGDDVRAVIIGNAVNNDGDTKVGFTAPSQQGQAQVIAQALSVAGIAPRTIGFVEAHGTATALGDPIEVAALTDVYGRRTHDSGWCPIGSVKTNIGHLGAAAGIVGLLKATLAVQNGIVPPSLNFEVPNPAIEFGQNPFFVNTAPWVWNDGAGMPRRAAVSSFGMGGTNAHVILEQAPARTPATAPPPAWHLIQVSAKTETALTAYGSALADYLATPAPAQGRDLRDVAYTLRVGRQELPKRLAVVAADATDAAHALRDKRRQIAGSADGEASQPVFLFPGQGAQHAGMGADIYASEPVYRDSLDECLALLERDGRPETARELRELLISGGDDQALRQTRLAQPALFIVEYALAKLWRSWGVTPRAMIGHSIGEYVAATCAGVFGLRDGLRVVAGRGEFMQSVPTGTMIAVQADEAELRGLLPERVSIAAVNGPGACVVAGPASAVDGLVNDLGAAEIGFRQLRTSHAFHTAMMDPILSAFRDLVAAAELKPPQIPFASNITGEWITAQQATDPSYWARHLREAVRFGDCVATVAAAGADLFVECGPGTQLSGLIRLRRSGHTAIPCLPGPGKPGDSSRTLATAVAQLWAAGCHLDAEAVGPSGYRIALPTYPWERQPHWVDPEPDFPGHVEPDSDQDGHRSSVLDDLFALPVWRQLTSAARRRAPSRVLALADDRDGIADLLVARGSEVIRVYRGTRYECDGSGSYHVRPASREDYETLVADLTARGGIPTHIVHSWTMADGPADGVDAAWMAQDDGFFSVLALAQALAATPPDGGVHIDVVTAGTQEAVGRDLNRPEHATLAGAVKVLPLEFPWLTARHIDADSVSQPQAGAAGISAEAVCIVDEIGVAAESPDSTSEPLVALRNGRRWHRRFEHIALSRTEDGGHDGIVLRENGVYLITGGLGGIGITLAEDLATRFAAKLILTSREGLPPREMWDAPDTAAALSARARRAIEAIRRIEQAGTEVHVVAADVADPAAACALRDEAIARFGRIDGIVCAAGVAGGGMAEIKDRNAAENVLRPKIAGTLALRDAFAGQALDFVLLCSSVTAVAGGFGQVDYCAANAFLDAHAGSDHGWNARVVSVNWGAWGEVGMAAESSAPATLRTMQRGQRVLPIGHGLLTERHDEDDLTWCSGTVGADTHWLMADHRIAGVPVLPGTAYLEAARCAFEECHRAPGPGHVVELRDVVFTHPLAVPDGVSAEVRVALTPGADGTDFEVTSHMAGVTRAHARGSAAWVVAAPEQAPDLAAIAERCSIGAREGESQAISRSGLLTFGPHWGNLIRVHDGAREALALLAMKEDVESDPYPWTIQPALLDEALASGWPDTTEAFLPLGYGRVVLRRRLPARIWGHLRYRDAGAPDMQAADATLYDEAGQELLRVEDFYRRKVDGPLIAGTVTAGGSEDLTDEISAAAEAISPAADAISPAEDAISPAAGAEAFRRLVNAKIAPQIVVSATSIEAAIAASRRADYAALAPQDLAGVGAETGERSSGGLVGSHTEREAAVAEILQKMLGSHAIGLRDDFFDLGGDSLLASQFIAFVRAQFGIRIPLRRFFADPTVTGIAALIDELSVAPPAADADVR
jgi:phthiocerol/phenolphthiocerol synthesis type-I polyketide synthase E